MVGDDQVEMQFPCEGGFGHTGDAAVDGDDESRRVVFVQLSQRIAVQAVAVFHPTRDEVVDSRPGQLQAVPTEAVRFRLLPATPSTAPLKISHFRNGTLQV